MDPLRKAIELVLKLHEHKEANVPGYTVHLDPKAEEQLRAALAEPEQATFIEQLRVLQHAANMLSYPEFLSATGWQRDDYSRDKYIAFQALGQLHRFDDHTLIAAVSYYLGRKLGEEHAMRQIAEQGTVAG